jgi:hypothetical protein
VESQFLKELPVLIIDVVGAAVGFVIAISWWKASGRELDRDAVVFIAKLFGGIALAGMILAFII